MHTLLDETDLEDQAAADREISLGTGTILGIFFALALVCAGFFGFGYTLGRKSAQDAYAPSNASSGGAFRSFKPAAGSLTGQPQSAPAADPADPVTPSPASVVVNTRPGQTGTQIGTQTGNQTGTQTESQPAPTPAQTAGQTSAPAPPAASGTRPGDSAPKTTAPALPPMPNISASGNFVVQVAAVSSQDLADIEMATLKKKGYNVILRHEAQDSFLHVVIGPFAARRDAEAMRLRVLDDGFNAIVK